MSIMTCVHGTAAEVDVMRVYFTGTDTLLEGYPVCFNFDALDVDAENRALTSIDVGQEFWNDARRLQVEKSTEGNKLHFAGVVSEKSDGITGPAWIEIHRPGSICNVYAASSVDHGQTGITTNTGQTLTFAVGTYTFITGGYCGTGSAIVLQDEDRSSTNGLIMAELMSGAPSGGVNEVACLSSSSGFSLALGEPCVYAGVYQLSESATASSAIMSTVVGLSDGDYVDQQFKMVLVLGTAISNTGLSVAIVKAYKSCLSATANGMTSGIADLSLAGDEVELRFNGARWVVITSAETSQLTS